MLCLASSGDSGGREAGNVFLAIERDTAACSLLGLRELGVGAMNAADNRSIAIAMRHLIVKESVSSNVARPERLDCLSW